MVDVEAAVGQDVADLVVPACEELRKVLRGIVEGATDFGSLG
ncbi:hypothetical protein [Streptomyces sp. NPDC003483]